jgi:VWFA-related protein
MNPRLISTFLVLAGLTAVGALVPFSPSAATQNQNHPVFSARSELVVLHVIVRDKSGSDVANLVSNAFTILEDGQVQTIQFFEQQDAPVTVGLLIDSSGSMWPVRDRVIAAATTFAETSNPQDEIFALAFNEQVRAALPPAERFTSDPEALRAALSGAISARGRTALYDAISDGLAYVAGGTHERKVLVVLSDGGDNASTAATFENVLRLAQTSNTVIYTVALTDPIARDANPKQLKALSDASGGEASVPRDVTDVKDVLRRIARDIRNTYTLGYVSTNSAHDGRLRLVQVKASTAAGRPLVVHTRRGYAVEAR